MNGFYFNLNNILSLNIFWQCLDCECQRIAFSEYVNDMIAGKYFNKPIGVLLADCCQVVEIEHTEICCEINCAMI